jgi:hypothetical protein
MLCLFVFYACQHRFYFWPGVKITQASFIHPEFISPSVAFPSLLRLTRKAAQVAQAQYPAIGKNINANVYQSVKNSPDICPAYRAHFFNRFC